MPDGEPRRQDAASEDLASVLRATISRYRTLLEQETSPQKRSTIERLLAESEAALSELETPEEW